MGPSVATTTIPGAGRGRPASAGGTVDPQPTTTIPLTPAATGAGAPIRPMARSPAPRSRRRRRSAPGRQPPGHRHHRRRPGGLLPASTGRAALLRDVDRQSRRSTPSPRPTKWRSAPALTGPLTDAATACRRSWQRRSGDGRTARRWRSRRCRPARRRPGRLVRSVLRGADRTAHRAGGAETPPDPIDGADGVGVDRNQLTAAATASPRLTGRSRPSRLRSGQAVSSRRRPSRSSSNSFPAPPI